MNDSIDTRTAEQLDSLITFDGRPVWWQPGKSWPTLDDVVTILSDVPSELAPDPNPGDVLAFVDGSTRWMSWAELGEARHWYHYKKLNREERERRGQEPDGDDTDASG